MIATFLRLILAFIVVISVTAKSSPASATSAMRRQMDSCIFDRGSAVLTSNCQSKLNHIASCWTHPRTIFWISPENENFRINGRSFGVHAFAAINENGEVSPRILALQRGSNIMGYLTSQGVPRERIEFNTQTDDFREDTLSQSAVVTGCLDYNYRSSSDDSFQPSNASTKSKLTCPLFGEDADYPTSSSYTSFGQTLDFEPLAMGMMHASSPDLAHCSDTPLPIYRQYTSSEAKRLRALVKTEAWKKQVEYQNFHYLQSYIQQALGEANITIAHSLLQAVWSAKPESRTVMLTRAAAVWSKIAVQRNHDDDWIRANWLQVDLNRQLGNYSIATRYLQNFENVAPIGGHIVTALMIGRERRLIEAHKSISYPATDQYPEP